MSSMMHYENLLFLLLPYLLEDSLSPLEALSRLRHHALLAPS